MWYVTYVYANHRPPQRLVQQAPATQLTCAQAPAGELIGHRSPARSRTAFATRPSRSSCCPLTASAPACLIPSVKQTQSTRCGYRGYAFFEYRPYPQVCTHEVHGWELKSGSSRDWGQQLVVRGQLHSPTGQLVMRVARVPPKRGRCFNSTGTSFHVVLELEHVEPVDKRSATREADAVICLPSRVRASVTTHSSASRSKAGVVCYF